MGIFSSIFGSEKVIDAGISGIDKAFYTEQEKAETALQTIELKTKLLKSFEPFKLAQRLLALVFASLFSVAFLFALTFIALGKPVGELLSIIDAFNLGVIIALIVGFYFGGGAVEGIIRSKKNGS